MSEQDALDRAAALEAENQMLREAMQRFFAEAYIDLTEPRIDAPDFRLTGMKEIRDLLARPPGAAGQAVLDAGDELSQILNSLYDAEHGRNWVYAYDVVFALKAWDQARSGAPGAAAPGGQPSGEGGDGG